jgi:hypothetical protein
MYSKLYFRNIPKPVWAVGFALEQTLRDATLAVFSFLILKRLQHKDLKSHRGEIMSKIAKSKIIFIFFELIFILFSSVFLCFAEPVANSDTNNVAKNGKQNIDRNLEKVNLLVQRAKLFDHFLEESNWASFGELVKGKHSQKEGSNNIVLSMYHFTPPNNVPKGKYINHKEIIPYYVCVCNQLHIKNEDGEIDDEPIIPIAMPIIELALWNDENKKVAGYIEQTSTFSTSIVFYKNDSPQFFNCRYFDKKIPDYDDDNAIEIDWDENGKITLSEKLEQLQKLPPLVTKLSNNVKNSRRLPTINLSTIKDQKILQVLRRTEKIAMSKNFNELFECLKELPLFDKKEDHPTISVRLVNDKLQHISILRDSLDDEKFSYYGYFLSFKNDNLHIYAEGDIPIETTNYYDATIKDNTKLDNLSIDGKGIEIKFHPNGFPASYKSIVQNRLYGRQIEWDDKGEIVSDVELDIPQKWKDAPKENKSQTK